MERSVSGVGVLDKAVAILDALVPGPRALRGLVRTTGLPRPTAHRLACALARHGLVERGEDGSFQLGRRLAELGAAAAATGEAARMATLAAPALEALRDATGESVQLFVRSGEARVCVASLQSPHGLRTIVELGETLPLDRGSAGRVLSGQATGAFTQSVEEREKGVASVSAPVRKAGRVVAAVSVSGPLERTTRSPGARYGALVASAARQVEAACGFA
jgi:DNA-binding IclR family transcriptional regulator